MIHPSNMNAEQLAEHRKTINVHCAACGGEYPGTTELHNGICDDCHKLTHGPNYRLIAELNRKAEEVERLRARATTGYDFVSRQRDEALTERDGARAEVERLREKNDRLLNVLALLPSDAVRNAYVTVQERGNA